MCTIIKFAVHTENSKLCKFMIKLCNCTIFVLTNAISAAKVYSVNK